MERKVFFKTNLEKWRFTPNDKDLSIFCQQFAILLNAGLTISETLTLLSQGKGSKSLSKELLVVRDAVTAGYGLSNAMKRSRRVFPRLLVEMIGTAEQAGSLTVVLERLSAYYRRRSELKSQLLQATLYPMIILGLSVAIIIFLMAEVVPVFADIISSMNGEIPLMTQMLMGIGKWFSTGWVWLLLILTLAGMAVKLFLQKPIIAHWFGIMTLKMPVIGKLLENRGCLQLAQTLSILLSGGVLLPIGLSVCQGVVGNAAMAEVLKYARSQVISGHSLSGCFIESERFPAEFCQMLRVGEESGSLVETLNQAADYYLQDFTRRTKLLTTLLEPLVMLIVGSLVLIVLLSVMQPIYHIYDLYTGMF